MENKRPANIGYNHPDSTISSRGSKYKTFSEGKKPKKKEKFRSTTVGNQYASYNTTQNTKQSNKEIERDREKFEAVLMHGGDNKK